MTEAHYKEFRTALHIARVEHRNAAARYGAVVNRQGKTADTQNAINRAARDLDAAARVVVYAEQIFAMAEHEIVREAGLSTSAFVPNTGDRS